MTAKRTVRNDVGEVTIREEGIVIAKTFPGVVINLKQAEEYHSLVEYLTSSKAHSTIVDISNISSLKAEAREFLVENSNDWGKTVALALVVGSATSKLIGNFFLTINKPKYPVKLFTDGLEAMSWAKQEYAKYNMRKAS